MSTSASLEQIDCDGARGLDKTFVRQLMSCQWAKQKQNIIINGATGTGKLHRVRDAAVAARTLVVRYLNRRIHDALDMRGNCHVARARARVLRRDRAVRLALGRVVTGIRHDRRRITRAKPRTEGVAAALGGGAVADFNIG